MPDSSSNQVTWTSVKAAANGFLYDAAGNVFNDNVNTYLYDGEGRICAVMSAPAPGMRFMTGYLYDADGTRVAKGTITSMSCDPAVNGFQTTSDYVLGLSDEQVTEMGVNANGTLAHQHTNVWAGGKLLGTYDDDGLHFYLDDPLGTRRVQTDYAGVIEQQCASFPFGDGETCTATPTEHLFTGKERDTESGNDYFGARCYASNMGRWMSPDPIIVSHDVNNPQTWNRYSYAFNNPLSLIDPDGKWPTPKHHQLMSDVFYSKVGAHGVAVLDAASDWVDCIRCGNQSAENSYMHFMLNGNLLYGQGRTDEIVAEGYAESYRWIFTNIDEAVKAQLYYEAGGGKGNSDIALTYLGRALHTIQDGTSPEHRGMQPWYGMSDVKDGLNHKLAEELSAKGEGAGDVEAQYEAQVQSESYWHYYQGQLNDARKKLHRKKPR